MAPDVRLGAAAGGLDGDRYRGGVGCLSEPDRRLLRCGGTVGAAVHSQCEMNRALLVSRTGLQSIGAPSRLPFADRRLVMRSHGRADVREQTTREDASW